VEKPKLFIDEDVHDKLAGILRSYGIDAISARESGRKGLSDKEQLNYAISQKRALFSFNIADYEKLAIEFFHDKKEHFGIILSPQRGFSDTLQRLLKLLQNVNANQIKNQVRYI